MVGGGLIAYGVAGQVFGAFDLKQIAGQLRRRRGRRAAQG